jgi:FixJ family two-component response regulator
VKSDYYLTSRFTLHDPATGGIFVKEKILIVDDEPQLCSLLEVILKDSGYEVTTLQEAPKTIETKKKTGTLI